MRQVLLLCLKCEWQIWLSLKCIKKWRPRTKGERHAASLLDFQYPVWKTLLPKCHSLLYIFVLLCMESFLSTCLYLNMSCVMSSLCSISLHYVSLKDSQNIYYYDNFYAFLSGLILRCHVFILLFTLMMRIFYQHSYNTEILTGYKNNFGCCAEVNCTGVSVFLNSSWISRISICNAFLTHSGSFSIKINNNFWSHCFSCTTHQASSFSDRWLLQVAECIVFIVLIIPPGKRCTALYGIVHMNLCAYIFAHGSTVAICRNAPFWLHKSRNLTKGYKLPFFLMKVQCNLLTWSVSCSLMHGKFLLTAISWAVEQNSKSPSGCTN